MKHWAILFCLLCVGFLGGWWLAAVITPSTSQQIQELPKRVVQLPTINQLTPKPSLLPIPSAKTLTGGTQTFQTFNNCGPASLSMALSHYGMQVSQAELGRVLRPFHHPTGDNDDKSVTLVELAAQAESYGFTVFHRPAGNIAMIQQFVAADIPVITRTWLKPNEDIGHYRVVIGYDQQRGVLVQDDSLQGAGLEYAEQDYLNLWQAFNYEFLVLAPKEKVALAEKILGELLEPNVAWQTALELSDRQLSENPSDEYAQFNRSVALYYLDQPAQAVAAFEQVESKLPARMLWYQIEPILAYYKLGNTQKVFSISNKILFNQNRAFSELHYLQGKIWEEQGNSTEAAAAFARATQYNSGQTWLVNISL